MNVQQKELVLLPYPFSNLKERKVRPALIISNNTFNKKSTDCIMVPLTTVIRDVDYSILLKQEDLTSGKLLKLSRIRVDKVFAVEKNLIIMKIGTVNNHVFSKIKKEVLKIF